MFVVTGASGQLGRKIVENLITHFPAERIGISVRNPGKVADFQALGIRVRHADYEDAESLRHAWEGAKRLLLVSSNAASTGGDPLAQHRLAIDVARAVGVQRIFYTSQIASSPTSFFPPALTHAATEAMLANSGLAWTALRHGFYADSALTMNARGFSAGSLAAPIDGRVSWTTHDDLAAADAALMVSEQAMDGPTPALTGSEALDLSDLAALAGSILKKPISRQIVGDDQMLENAQKAGVAVERLAVMIGYYRAARSGEFGEVNPFLANLIGREPQRMASFMAQYLAPTGKPLPGV